MKEIIDSTIESHIIELLKNSSLSTIQVIEKINRIRPDTTKQAVYLALRKLKKKEIVAISGKRVSLHQSWVTKMKNFFLEVDKKTGYVGETSVLGLKEKEYITYKFNSLLSLDMFWDHAFIIFMKSLSAGKSIFLYNPHQWFLIVRKESELGIIEEAKKREVSWLQMIGNRSHLDLEVKKYFDNEYARCYILDTPAFPTNYYANCFGDFLIEVWIDPRAAEELETIYSKHESIDENVIKLLKSVIQKENYKHKMKISRHASKAEKIKNLFKKYFIIEER